MWQSRNGLFPPATPRPRERAQGVRAVQVAAPALLCGAPHAGRRTDSGRRPVARLWGSVFLGMLSQGPGWKEKPQAWHRPAMNS